MITLHPRVGQLPGYPLARIPSIKRRLIESGVDVIDLGAGDADGPPPAGTIAALKEALDSTANHKYGFQQGAPDYRRAAAAWVERRFGVKFDQNTELLPLIGSKEGLAHLALTVAGPGDVVIVPEPGYQAYLGGAILAGAEPYIVPLRAERDFLLELDDVPEEILSRTRIVYVNYPNNPTAAVAPIDYLERLVAGCRQRGIVLAYDNPYCDITFDGYVAPGIFQVEGARDVAVEFFSMSKSFQMTGWRLGFAVGNATLIGALSKVKTYVDTGAFMALQRAAAWTLDNAESLIPPVLAELTVRRDAALAALRRIGLRVEPPVGAMYLWVPLPTGVESGPFAERALEEQGVVVLPGSGFGAGGEGYFRIALTVPAGRIEEAVGRLARVLERSDRGGG